jgi:AcrR family transcriptional regulator
MDHGRETFEGLIAASVGDPSRGMTLSPVIAKGIVGGVERVTRTYLLAGKSDRLTNKADELSSWVSCYRPWSQTPAEAPEAVTRLPAGLRCKDVRLRILRAAAAISANDGYLGLSAGRITRLAEVSEETFASFYSGTDAIRACFLASLDLLGVEALVCVARASREACDWPERVRSGITALLNHVAGHPFIGPLAFIEIFAVGPSGIERGSRLLTRFTDQLVKALPAAQRPSELVADAIVGAIWAIVHDYVVRRQAHLLPELADDATYLALAPAIGHDAAVHLLTRDRGVVSRAPTVLPRQADGRETALVTDSALTDLRS